MHDVFHHITVYCRVLRPYYYGTFYALQIEISQAQTISQIMMMVMMMSVLLCCWAQLNVKPTTDATHTHSLVRMEFF